MRIRPTASPRRTLFIGFGVLIALLLGMALSDWWSKRVIKSRVDEIVHHYAAKERLIRELLGISRHRAILMYQMLLEEDPFERDDLTQDFRQLATEFFLKYQHLMSLGLNADEKKYFNRSVSITRHRYLVQQEAIDLMEDGQIEASRILIAEKAIPAQVEQLANLQNMVRYQEQRMVEAVARAERDFERAQDIMLVITGVLVLSGLLIAVFVIRDSTTLYRMTNAAKREAETASNAKAEFLARMSHEIRTPLNAINGMTELLQGTRVSQEQADFLQVMRTSGNALMSLIDDILDFSKIEAGKLELENIPFNLRDCVLEALEIRASAAAAKGLELCYWIEPDLPVTVMGDPNRLRQVLINLIGNAVKFTESGEVRLRVNATEEKSLGEQALMRFEVADTGAGIPQDRLQRLFNAFDQSDASISRRFGGTGLGLNISQYLVNCMGGRIGVKSDPGKGAVFSFIIPLQAPADAPVPAKVDQRLQGRHILVVNRNPTHRDTIRDILKDNGARVSESSSCEEAWGHLRAPDTIDAAVVDLVTATRRDDDCLGDMRQKVDLAALPVLVFADIGVACHRSDEAHTSVTHYPVRPDRLITGLGRAIEGHQVAELESTPDEQLSGSHPLRILLVEDSEMNRTVATSMLKRFGYQTDMAVNGREGVEACLKNPYDLVLMDVQMPELDGVEATKAILGRCQGSQPYIVAMTANALAGDRERYLTAGMDDYLPKPVQLQALRDVLLRCPARVVADSAGLDFLDARALADLRKLAGEKDEDLVPYFMVYLKEASAWVDGLRRLADDPEHDAVIALAHPLKSNSRQIGAMDLAGFCEILEAEARAGNLQSFAPQRDQIVATFETLAVRLQAFLDRG